MKRSIAFMGSIPRKSMLGILVILALLVVPFAALADELVIDDLVVVDGQYNLNLGTIYTGTCGVQSASGNATLKIKRTGNNQEAFKFDQDPVISYVVDGQAFVELDGNIIDLPDAWQNTNQNPEGTLSEDSVTATITVGPGGTLDQNSATVTFKAQGPAHAGGATLERFAIVSVSWFVAPCPEQWRIDGFHAPVKAGVNKVKAGSTVPLKFNVYQDSGGGEVEQTNPDVVIISIAPTAGCGSPASDPVLELSNAGATQLRYENGEFIQNWKTPPQPGACYTVTMTAGSASTSASFELR